MERVRGFEIVRPEHSKLEPLSYIRLPSRGSKNSAGYDFYSPVDLILAPGEQGKFPTDLKAYMQPDEFLFILPRSSVGIKAVMLTNTGGVVDSDYYENPKNDGNMFMFLHNLGDEPFIINAGDRVTQGIFMKYLLVDGDSLDQGAERVGGYGHTGK